MKSLKPKTVFEQIVKCLWIKQIKKYIEDSVIIPGIIHFVILIRKKQFHSEDISFNFDRNKLTFK